MEYEKLKESLKSGLEMAYMINGGDGYLCHSALSIIEDALSLSMPDMNRVVFSDDFSGLATDIIASCEALPMIDAYRLVIVYDYVVKKNDTEKNIFLNYLKSPNPQTILVFFSSTKSDFFSTLENKVTTIACDKVSDYFLQHFVQEKCEKLNISIDMKTINHLIDYCNHSLTKIDIEVDKLHSIVAVGDDCPITYKDVDDFVVKDLEYVIFDLTKSASMKDASKVYEIIDDMLKNKEQPISIISLLSNHFRRLFFVLKSSGTNEELSTYLGVKEFAIKKYREQASLFTVKKLKSIFDDCTNTEFMCKSGQMGGRNALFYLCAKILS